MAFAREVAFAGAAAAKLGVPDVTAGASVTLTAVVLMPAMQASQCEARVMIHETLLSYSGNGAMWRTTSLCRAADAFYVSAH